MASLRTYSVIASDDRAASECIPRACGRGERTGRTRPTRGQQLWVGTRPHEGGDQALICRAWTVGIRPHPADPRSGDRPSAECPQPRTTRAKTNLARVERTSVKRTRRSGDHDESRPAQQP